MLRAIFERTTTLSSSPIFNNRRRSDYQSIEDSRMNGSRLGLFFTTWKCYSFRCRRGDQENIRQHKKAHTHNTRVAQDGLRRSSLSGKGLGEKRYYIQDRIKWNEREFSPMTLALVCVRAAEDAPWWTGRVCLYGGLKWPTKHLCDISSSLWLWFLSLFLFQRLYFGFFALRERERYAVDSLTATSAEGVVMRRTKVKTTRNGEESM